MKYLELECTAKITGDIVQIEETIPGVTIRLEVYSLKKTREEKKNTHSGKYKSYSSMISAALNLTFFGYEISVTSQELFNVTEKEAKSSLVSKMFTLGITKDYIEMVNWVDKAFKTIKECSGTDGTILRVEKRTGPFEKCFWSECLVVYGKELKRMTIFIVMYGSTLQSPLL